MSAPVRAVLADLDDTLFDHLHATRRALTSLSAMAPAFRAWSPDELERRHGEILERLHLDVLSGRRTIDQARIARFTELLEASGGEATSDRAAQAATLYRGAYEEAWRAVPGALALVAAVRGGGLPLVIVTNNGVAEQRRKLRGIGLDGQITALVTSEEVGVSKPAHRIFEVALAAAGVEAHEAVMFGDAWSTDVVGAQGAGIPAVWFNRRGLDSPDGSVPELRSLEPADRALARLIDR